MLVNIIAIDIFGRKRTALSLYLALALCSFAVLACSIYSIELSISTNWFFCKASASRLFSSAFWISLAK